MRYLSKDEIEGVNGAGLWDEVTGWINFTSWSAACGNYAPSEYKACMNRNGWNTDGTRYYG